MEWNISYYLLSTLFVIFYCSVLLQQKQQQQQQKQQNNNNKHEELPFIKILQFSIRIFVLLIYTEAVTGSVLSERGS